MPFDEKAEAAESQKLDKLQGEIQALDVRASDVLPRVSAQVPFTEPQHGGLAWQRRQGEWHICFVKPGDRRNGQLLTKMSVEVRARGMKAMPRLFKAVLDKQHRRSQLVDDALGDARTEAWKELPDD